MGAAQNSDALAEMKRLREDIMRRLEANPDFRALAALDEAIAKVEGRPHGPLAIIASAPPVTVTAAPVRERPMSQMDACAQALSIAGEPMSTKLLLKKITKLGAKVGGKNPLVNLGSSLSRDDRFDSVRWGDDRGWWLRGRTLPAQKSLGNSAQETDTAESAQGSSAVPSVNH